MSLLGAVLGLVSGIVAGIVNTLAQDVTNGLSLLGTLEAATFPKFLTNNPLPNGYPWGTKTASGSDPYTEYPNTGIVRMYDFTVTRGRIAPDGYYKDVILINGQFPGPTIEANWGDTFQITVHNQISNPEEGTSFHWHGMLQKGTPYMDGVPAIEQCPIAPGSSFTYTFQAELYGTSWYHSHYSAQYAGGLLGPMIVHGPSNADYDIDLGPVFLSDYYHQEYFEIVESVVAGGGKGNPRPESDNNLINGKMTFDCSTKAAGDNTECADNAGISKFKFTTGKTHRLRLINAGGEALQRFSIDEHEMTVIANDYVPIEPYTTNVVTLGVGQRSDVLVTAKGDSNSAYWMRSNISTACSGAKQPYALAAIYYDQADTDSAPDSSAWDVPDPGTCANDDLSVTIPYYKINTVQPETTQTYEINNYVNDTGSFLWTLDGVSMRVDYNDPILYLATEGNYSYPTEWNVRNFGSNSSIRVIVNNPTPAAHPMHLHGHNMQILSEGPGNWDGTIVRSSNPQRRDVQQLRPNGHMVWQITTDNPGAWTFHCHIVWHSSGGLVITILERPEDIKKADQDYRALTCDNWMKYTNRAVVEQVDSGI
ncbi:multicopper oxidase protein [Rutstroemia sp. NJR-2017a BBW]|nr:multicopper oxidase protein [Rutstroemia sp. NJR-2017a BBW]